MGVTIKAAGFRERLLADHVPLLVGSFHEFRDPLLIEAVCRIGFDFVVLEHQLGLRDPSQLEYLIRAADITDTPVLVRVGLECDQGFVSRVLSAGAMGLVASFDGSVASAERLASWMLYPPKGQRAPGYCRGGTGYRNRIPWMFGSEEDQRMVRANEDVVLVLRFETKLAIDNVRDIMAIDGVTAVMPSPGNICTNLCIQPGSSELQRIIANLHAAARETGGRKTVFRFVTNAAGALAAAKDGAAAVILGHDTTIITGLYQELEASIRAGRQSNQRRIDPCEHRIGKRGGYVSKKRAYVRCVPPNTGALCSDKAW